MNIYNFNIDRQADAVFVSVSDEEGHPINAYRFESDSPIFHWTNEQIAAEIANALVVRAEAKVAAQLPNLASIASERIQQLRERMKSLINIDPQNDFLPPLS